MNQTIPIEPVQFDDIVNGEETATKLLAEAEVVFVKHGENKSNGLAFGRKAMQAMIGGQAQPTKMVIVFVESGKLQQLLDIVEHVKEHHDYDSTAIVV